jgi:hypothetical protein
MLLMVCSLEVHSLLSRFAATTLLLLSSEEKTFSHSQIESLSFYYLLITHDRPPDLYVASSDTCEGAGTDWEAAAFDITVVSSFNETRERSPLLLAPADGWASGYSL